MQVRQMDICVNCFEDNELRGFISSSGSIGDCRVCNSTHVPILDLSEVLDFFQELLNNFHISDTGTSLRSKIKEDWNLFSSERAATIILNEALRNASTVFSNAEDPVDYNDDIVENYSHWEALKRELKWNKRFLINIEHITDDLGWDGFFNTQYALEPDVSLYRARVHHTHGKPVYSPAEMMAPEPKIVKSGRANPLGIPFLYLSDNPDTVLYEVRASYLDELSIGTFHLKEEFKSVKIVDFTENTSLFQPGKVNETIKARLLREKISFDLSKPMRRYDSELDYIPTQFICEFIKIFTGSSGIRFKSSLHPAGRNVVIFDQTLMECSEVVLKRVNSLNLSAIDLI
jgi:hypothetical protein